MIAAAATIIILIIVAIVASLSGDNQKKDQDTSQTIQSSELTRAPTAIDIENVNNSISSSVTSLDDEADFPEANLTDKNLDL